MSEKDQKDQHADQILSLVDQLQAAISGRKFNQIASIKQQIKDTLNQLR